MLDKIPLELFQNILLYLDTESSQGLEYINKNIKNKYKYSLPIILKRDVQFIKFKLLNTLINKTSFKNICFISIFKHKCNNLMVLECQNSNSVKIYTSSKNLQLVLCKDISISIGDDICYSTNDIYYNNSKTQISITLVKTLIS